MRVYPVKNLGSGIRGADKICARAGFKQYDHAKARMLIGRESHKP